jgi:hypothetical protein
MHGFSEINATIHFESAIIYTKPVYTQFLLGFSSSDRCEQGRNLRGGEGGVTPAQNMNHLDWQSDSSGLAGQSKILNDRM